jgi:hypothetical protein
MSELKLRPPKEQDSREEDAGARVYACRPSIGVPASADISGMPDRPSSTRRNRKRCLGPNRISARAGNRRTILPARVLSSDFHRRAHTKLTTSRFWSSDASGRRDSRLDYPTGLGVDIELAARGARLDRGVN